MSVDNVLSTLQTHLSEYDSIECGISTNTIYSRYARILYSECYQIGSLIETFRKLNTLISDV